MRKALTKYLAVVSAFPTVAAGFDTVYREYTLVIYLSDTTLDEIHTAADEMAGVFRQNSALIQENPSRTEFCPGKRFIYYFVQQAVQLFV